MIDNPKKTVLLFLIGAIAILLGAIAKVQGWAYLHYFVIIGLLIELIAVIMAIKLIYTKKDE